MNSLFLTSNGDPNKIVFRVMDGKAVCYCSHPSVLFCNNCIQMTRNIVNSWDLTPNNYFEKEDLIGQTLFHKSRSHLLEIIKELRNMENKRIDQILSKIMEDQKKDDFEDFGKLKSQITKFDELKKIDDKEEYDEVGLKNENIQENNKELKEYQKQQENEENEEFDDNDEIFKDNNDDDDDDDGDDDDEYEEEEIEEEIIILKPSLNSKRSSNIPNASKKQINKKSTITNSVSNKNNGQPIKINILDGDNDEEFDVKVYKKTNQSTNNNNKRKNKN